MFKITRWGRPGNVYKTQVCNVHETLDETLGRSKDVHGTSVKHVSKIKLTNTLNLLWQVTQDFLMNGSSEKFSEQFSGQNSYLNRKQT